MTNEEKAQEIIANDVCCVWNGGCPNVYYGAMEMAKWKDKQMIDKACEWLEKHVEDFMPPTNSLHDYNTSELIHFFKKAMKGGEE